MENNKKNEATKVDTMAAQKKAQDEYPRYEYNDAKKFVRSGLAEIKDGQLINLTTGETMGYVDEPKKVEKSKVVEKVLLLAAQKSSKSNKLGVTVLRYDSIDGETGQIFVKKAFGSGERVATVVTTWFEMSEDGSDAYILTLPVLSPLYVALTGSGDFLNIANILTPEEVKIVEKFMF